MESAYQGGYEVRRSTWCLVYEAAKFAHRMIF